MLKTILAALLLVITSSIASAQSPGENFGFHDGFITVASQKCCGAMDSAYKRAVALGVDLYGKQAIQRGIDDGVKTATDEADKTCASAIIAYGPNGMMVSDAYVPPRKKK